MLSFVSSIAINCHNSGIVGDNFVISGGRRQINGLLCAISCLLFAIAGLLNGIVSFVLKMATEWLKTVTEVLKKRCFYLITVGFLFNEDMLILLMGGLLSGLLIIIIRSNFGVPKNI